MPIDALFERWRDHLRRHANVAVDIEPLERGLRVQMMVLMEAGLSEEEAFLVAVKRLGGQDAPSRTFAMEQAERTVWKPFATARRPRAGDEATLRETCIAFGLAVLAALLVKLPELWGLGLNDDSGFYARNFALFVLPLLAGYFAWKRGAATATRAWLASGFVAAAVFANLYSSWPSESLEALTALHLPIASWLLVGIAHAGGCWSDLSARMRFVRFSGEWFVHYVLIALGGAVLMALTFAMFESIGLDAEPFFERWVLPCGALGAVIVAAWLVESRQGLAESMAPMLARLFTPLFAILLLVFLATMGWMGRGPEFHRELLIAFDLLLAVVVGLLLYAIASRDPARPPGLFDVLQIVLVLAALGVDAMMLWTIAARIDELGFTPNRVAALGENLLLLVNLAGSAVLYLRFVRGRGALAPLERWQMRYLPVYAAWAAIVVAVFPPWFGPSSG